MIALLNERIIVLYSLSVTGILLLFISVYKVENKADNGKDYSSTSQEDKDNSHWYCNANKLLSRYPIIGNKSTYLYAMKLML